MVERTNEMKIIFIINILLGIVDCKADNLEVFEAEQKVIEISTDSIASNFQNNEKKAAIFLWKKGNPLGVVDYSGDLQSLFLQAKEDGDSGEAFYGPSRSFVVHDDKLNLYFLLTLEDSKIRFQLAPLRVVGGDVFGSTDWRYSHNEPSIISLFNKIMKVKEE